MVFQVAGRREGNAVIFASPDPPEASRSSMRQPLPDSPAAFEACAVAWAPELARLAFLLTNDHDAADDVVADALCAAWQQWPSVAAAANPRAYVRRIVVNLAASRVRTAVRSRRRLRQLAGLTREVAASPDVPAALDLHRVLEQLPPGQRQCVVLRYGLDLSEAEVADLLQISPGTVKSQTSKGARRLRRLIEGERA